MKLCLFAVVIVLAFIGSGDAFFFLLKSLAHIGRYDTGYDDQYNYVQPTYDSKATIFFLFLFCLPFSV